MEQRMHFQTLLEETIGNTAETINSNFNSHDKYLLKSSGIGKIQITAKYIIIVPH